MAATCAATANTKTPLSGGNAEQGPDRLARARPGSDQPPPRPPSTRPRRERSRPRWRGSARSDAANRDCRPDGRTAADHGERHEKQRERPDHGCDDRQRRTHRSSGGSEAERDSPAPPTGERRQAARPRWRHRACSAWRPCRRGRRRPRPIRRGARRARGSTRATARRAPARRRARPTVRRCTRASAAGSDHALAVDSVAASDARIMFSGCAPGSSGCRCPRS